MIISEKGRKGGNRDKRSHAVPGQARATTLEEALSLFFSVSRLSYMHRIHGYIYAHSSMTHAVRELRGVYEGPSIDHVVEKKRKEKAAKRRLEK